MIGCCDPSRESPAPLAGNSHGQLGSSNPEPGPPMTALTASSPPILIGWPPTRRPSVIEPEWGTKCRNGKRAVRFAACCVPSLLPSCRFPARLPGFADGRLPLPIKRTWPCPLLLLGREPPSRHRRSGLEIFPTSRSADSFWNEEDRLAAGSRRQRRYKRTNRRIARDFRAPARPRERESSPQPRTAGGFQRYRSETSP